MTWIVELCGARARVVGLECCSSVHCGNEEQRDTENRADRILEELEPQVSEGRPGFVRFSYGDPKRNRFIDVKPPQDELVG